LEKKENILLLNLVQFQPQSVLFRFVFGLRHIYQAKQSLSSIAFTGKTTLYRTGLTINIRLFIYWNCFKTYFFQKHNFQWKTHTLHNLI